MNQKLANDSASASTKRSTKTQRSSSGHGSLGRDGSVEGNRRAATILEVLGGLRTPSEAAEVLKISVTHYYLLERKALRGLVAACEPQPKGPRVPTAEQQVARLQRELAQCQRECMRQAALVRATQRAVGLPAATCAKAKSAAQKTKAGVGAKPRRRKPTVRALRAVDVLRKNSSGVNSPDEVERLSTEEGDDQLSRRTNEERSHGTEG